MCVRVCRVRCSGGTYTPKSIAFTTFIQARRQEFLLKGVMSKTSVCMFYKGILYTVMINVQTNGGDTRLS